MFRAGELRLVETKSVAAMATPLPLRACTCFTSLGARCRFVLVEDFLRGSGIAGQRPFSAVTVCQIGSEMLCRCETALLAQIGRRM